MPPSANFDESYLADACLSRKKVLREERFVDIDEGIRD